MSSEEIKLCELGKLYVVKDDIIFWKFRNDKQCEEYFKRRTDTEEFDAIRRHNSCMIFPAAVIVYIGNVFIGGFRFHTMHKFLYGAEIIYISTINVTKSIIKLAKD